MLNAIMFKHGVIAIFVVGCKLQSGGTMIGGSSNPPASGSAGPAASSTPAEATSSSGSSSSSSGGSSSGASKPMTMPDISLMTMAQAEEALRRAGFERTITVDDWKCTSTTEDGKIVEPGRICYQKPSAGNNTGSKLPVTVRVQDKNPYEGDQHAKPWVFMPDLNGKTVEQAREALRTAGVTSDPKVIVKAGCKANTVCETFPAAEVRTGKDSEKLLYIGK